MKRVYLCVCVCVCVCVHPLSPLLLPHLPDITELKQKLHMLNLLILLLPEPNRNTLKVQTKHTHILMLYFYLISACLFMHTSDQIFWFLAEAGFVKHHLNMKPVSSIGIKETLGSYNQCFCWRNPSKFICVCPEIICKWTHQLKYFT